MSMPAEQLLPVQDLKRIQNLRSKETKTKATKREMSQYNEIKEEILQFMQFKKKKISTETSRQTNKHIRNLSLHAANDDLFQKIYTQQNTYLVD